MPDSDATSRIQPPAGGTVEQPLAPIRRPHGLIPYAEAAALSFLGLLALGAALLVVVKLQYTRLGSGADPVEMLTSVIILSLAVLRIPVHIGELTITVLPLGALAGFALIVSWACRSTLRDPSIERVTLVGLLFGMVAGLAALAFRHRFEPDPIFAGAPSAFFLGALWVALFAAWSVASRAGGSTGLLRRARDRLRAGTWLWEAVRAATIMLGGTILLATGAGLIWVIVTLLRGGGPQELDLGGLVAATVYVAAFAPNLVVAAAALSLGAPLEVGAGLTVRGRVRGTVQELSIASGEGFAPTLLMVAIPIAACATAGYWLSRNAAAPARPLKVLAAASGLFACALTVLSWLGEARLGAQLAADRGFGVVAPDAPSVFVMGMIWAITGGLLGWTLGRRGA